MNLLDEIKQTFKNGSVLWRLILVNLAVFVAIRLLGVVFFLSGAQLDVASFFGIPASVGDAIRAPWAIFTYMFTHWKFTHMLFNMLMLYWFGKIFLTYHDEKKLLGLYIMGGLSGALLFLLAFNYVPVFENMAGGYMIGASASVVAIIIASAVYAPNHVIHLFLIGPVKIVWIAIVSVFFYIIGITTNNAGGEIAHLGGAIWGLAYMWQMKKGNNFMKRFDEFVFGLGSLFKKRKKMRVSYKSNTFQTMSDRDYNMKKKAEKENINHILDKISKSGYESLSKSEKEILFKMSNNKKGKPN